MVAQCGELRRRGGLLQTVTRCLTIACRRTHRASVPARLRARGRRLVVRHWTWANTLVGAPVLPQPRIGSGAPAQPPGTSAGLVGWGSGIPRPTGPFHAPCWQERTWEVHGCGVLLVTQAWLHYLGTAPMALKMNSAMLTSPGEVSPHIGELNASTGYRKVART